ncbi:CrcB family protein [bacterium]|nr:CrcB family protein [bacterium]
MEIVAIFMGGAIGAFLRYIILSMFKYYPINVIGVFLVNMTGCFIIGFVTYIAIKKHHLINEYIKKLLIVGFAGGFTTFSAFSHPVIEMFFRHHYVYVFFNMFLSVIIGLIFVSWGMNCGYYFMHYLIKTKRISFNREAD